MEKNIFTRVDRFRYNIQTISRNIQHKSEGREMVVMGEGQRGTAGKEIS